MLDLPQPLHRPRPWASTRRGTGRLQECRHLMNLWVVEGSWPAEVSAIDTSSCDSSPAMAELHFDRGPTAECRRTQLE